MKSNKLLTFFSIICLFSFPITAGTPTRLNLFSVQEGAVADGYHRVRVCAEIRDSAGNFVQDATNTVTFGISGTGSFEGANVVKAQGGMAMINVISPTSSGFATIFCSSTGLTGDTLSLEWIEPRMKFTKFPIGIYEDVGPTWSYNFSNAIDDMRAHNFDSCMMGNGRVNRDEAVLNAAEAKDFDMYMGIVGSIGEPPIDWYDDSSPTITEAGNHADFILNNWGHYSCVQAWYTADEPGGHLLTQVKYLTQAFQEKDAQRPATPVLIGKERVRNHFQQSKLDVMCIDLYPAGHTNPIGSFNMSHWGYGDMDMVDYYRYVTQDKPVGIPVWIVLQTHQFFPPGAPQLRYPTREEVRCMHWLSIAEGVKGYFWFIYSEVGGWWTGLKNQSANYAETTDLAGRLKANGNRIRDVLFSSQRVPDMCTIQGATSPEYIRPHITTLMKEDGSGYYAVAVNHDCQESRVLTIDSPFFREIENLETDVVYELPANIPFRPGDGMIFELSGSDVDPDLNRDGPVDCKDLMILGASWLQSGPGMIQGDLNQDDSVNAHDFPLFAQGWTGLDVTAPSVPDGLVLDAVSDDEISFHWNVSEDDYKLGGYNIYRNGQYGTPWDSTEYPFYTDMGLVPETQYSYQISAYDTSGNESLLSEIFAVSTNPEIFNPVIDPSIEEGVSPWHDQTYVWEGPKFQGVYGTGLWDTQHPENAREGVAYYKVTGAPEYGYAYIDQEFEISSIAQAGKLKPNTNYTLQAYVNIPAPLDHRGVRLRFIEFYSIDPPQYSVYESQDLLGPTDGYVPIELDFSTKSNIVLGRIDLLWEYTSTNSAWFDSVRIIEVK